MGPRVIIIGAGVVGAALADELTQRGWDQVTVLDQGALPAPGGSSSHAPGLVFQTNSVKVLTRLAHATVAKLSTLESLPCFLRTGSLEVATTRERLTELHRRHGWTTSWGVESALLSPAETARRQPLLDPDRILGALFVPSDGIVNAVNAVAAQLDRARQRGARILDRHEVLAIRTTGRRVTAVLTDHAELPADIVVCCAGIWGPRIARMVGLALPLTPLAHQLAWTTPLPALAGVTTEAAQPIVRHQGADLYLRQRFDRVGIGSYAHRPMPIDADDIAPVRDADPMPSVLPFTPDDFDDAWRAASALMPQLQHASVAEGLNGLFSFTVDNLPLLGPAPEVDGFWVAEAVWVTHSAGVGKAMAEWLVDGECGSFDLHGCDITRFEKHQLAPDYVLRRTCQNYIEVYDIIHPLEPAVAPRGVRTSPFHARQVQLGAYFLESAGWERPQWYEANSVLLEGREMKGPNAWAARHWSPVVGAEAVVTRERAALFDMTPLKRLEVSGPGATNYLQWMTTADIDKPVGSITYCLLLNALGGIRGDITVARLDVDRYQVGANGSADLEWLCAHAPADGSVSVRDITAGTCCLGLWGPRARDILAGLTRDDVGNEANRYYRAMTTFVGAVPVVAMRLSYVGELGWELYTDADLGQCLWDTLWEAGQAYGMIAAGRGAFNSLRLEKGYRAFGVDMSWEHDPYEAGLGFAVNLAKGPFVGRDALIARANVVDGRARSVRRRLACLTVNDPTAVVLGAEPVYDGTGCVGQVTSAGYGYTVDTAIAYAWLPAELATPGRCLDIGYFDERISVAVAAEPLFDPTGRRPRG